LEVVAFQQCPKGNALQDCTPADKGTDTVKVDISKLSEFNDAAMKGFPIKDSFSKTPSAASSDSKLRSVALLSSSPPAPTGDSPVCFEDLSPSAETCQDEASPSLPEPEAPPSLPSPAFPPSPSPPPPEVAPPAKSSPSRSEVYAESCLGSPSLVACRRAADESMSTLDVEHVVAAMMVSEAKEEARLPQPVQDPSASSLEARQVSPAARRRSSSLASEEEPESEEPSLSACRPPSPDAVPSPGHLLPQRQRGGSVLDESRVRKASQLFAAMLRGETCTTRSRRPSRRKSAPPRKDTSAAPPADVTPPQKEGAGKGQAKRRASSLDSCVPAEDQDRIEAKLMPLNGQMPWFPPVEVQSAQRQRAGSAGARRSQSLLPWQDKARS